MTHERTDEDVARAPTFDAGTVPTFNLFPRSTAMSDERTDEDSLEGFADTAVAAIEHLTTRLAQAEQERDGLTTENRYLATERTKWMAQVTRLRAALGEHQRGIGFLIMAAGGSITVPKRLLLDDYEVTRFDRVVTDTIEFRAALTTPAGESDD